MRKIILSSIILALFLSTNLCYAQFAEDSPELDIDRKPLPPYSLRKVRTYEDFNVFDFTDLNGRQWTNRNGLNRPLLILTGKWALRHDIKKWAHYLALK